MPSVIKILQQAGHNPIKFVPIGRTLPAKYHSAPFDSELFKNEFRDWQAKSEYSQKYEFGDATPVQFHVNTPMSTATPTLTLIDCGMRDWGQFQPFMSSYPGQTWTYGGVEYPLYTSTHFIDFGVSTKPEGTYYLLLAVPYDTQVGAGTEDTDYFISEPIYLAEKHPDTVLVEYRNSRNQLNTIFPQLGDSLFTLRIEGEVEELTLKADDTTYNDQLRDAVLLNSYPYRSWKLFTGGAIGLPEWTWEKVHLSLSCNESLIEGTAYTKDESADWAVTRDQKRIWAEISLREAENYSGLTFVSRAPLVVFEVPADDFGAHSVVIDNVYTAVGYPVYGGDLTDVLFYLNNVLAPNQGLLGAFTTDQPTPILRRVIYQQHASENITQASATILDKKISFTKPVITTSSVTLFFTYKAYVVDWGDGGFEGAGDTQTTSTTPVTHNYPGVGGSKTFDVFHKGGTTLTYIEIAANIFSVTGDCPSGLVSFILMSSTVPAMDMSFFDPALATLATFEMVTGQLVSLTGFNRPWLALNFVYAPGNKLTTAGVNGILAGLRAALDTNQWVGSGTLDTGFQSPAAPPTGQGLTDKNVLINTYSWAVTTD